MMAYMLSKEKANKAVKPFACGSLGRSALRACSGMASPLLPDQSLHAERRLPWRYVQKIRGNSKPRIKVFPCSPLPLVSAEAR